MNPVSIFARAAAAALVLATATATAAPPSAFTMKKLDDKVDEGIVEGVYPGGVLLAGHGEETSPVIVSGNSRTEPAAEAMRADTIFDLASVSKVMGTATMTMLLIEDGRLTLDTRVSEIFPEYAANGKEDVAVRHLLTHSSGLKPYENWKVAEEKRGGSAQDEALFAQIASLDKRYPTGENILYSCLNYLSLARLNETVAGESQQEFLSRRVWAPLGMTDTTYHLNEEQRSRLAPTFKEWPDGSVRIHDPLANYYSVDAGNCSGNAGLFSTASDMGAYCRMIANRGQSGGVRVMKAETVEMMTTVHATLPKYVSGDETGDTWNRALGWHAYSDWPWTHPAAPQGAVIGHTGYTGTFLWINRETKDWIVFLTNSVYSKDPPQTSTIRKRLTAVMLEEEYGPAPQPGG